MAYATTDELQNLLTTDYDVAEQTTLYGVLLDSATAAVDNYCRRTFAVPVSASARYFYPTRDRCSVFQLDDIANTTDLAVAVDTVGTGTYSALTSSEWFAETNNETGMVDFIRFYSRVVWPRYNRRNIEVTARWGWPAVPEPVKQATLIWASRLYNRRESPAGVLGFGEMGAVRLPSLDPDVQVLLNPYVRLEKAVS